MFHSKKIPCAPKDGLVRTRLANPCANPRFFPYAEPLCGTFVQSLVRFEVHKYFQDVEKKKGNNPEGDLRYTNIFKM